MSNAQNVHAHPRVFTGSVAEVDIMTNLKHVNYGDTIRRLDNYYGIVKRQLLQHQSISLGLFPATTVDTEVADIRTSIYCSAAIWALYQAYKRIDDDRGKAYELGQSCVKGMRGILTCWMRQTDKVEKFKQGQQPKYALHSKLHLLTGEEVYPADTYCHLQIDVASLYLIFLVQMTSSGLQLIYTMDEVIFVQNLVYYVERSYRTPDFGMWERGTKYNNGTPELHASSIGMAKAALEAINGCNLFGEKGASWSVIFVDIDAHNRNRSIFETLLPRESSSKNVDASLLSVISFPAFATHDPNLYDKTKSQIVSTLKGKCGFKRFLRDGYGSVLEDRTKRFYAKGETKEFEKIESEWPLFYIYMILEGIFRGNEEQVEEYQKLMKPLLKTDKYGDPVIPKYFYIHDSHIMDEKIDPGSQPRQASMEGTARNLFLWGQSLWVIASLLGEKLLHINEMDLVRRYLPSYNRPRKGGRYSAFQSTKARGTASDLVVQVVLIAESMRLQAMMATYGIQTQTPHEVEPVQIWPPRQLVKVYQNLGVSQKMGLHGRPPRPIGALGTSKVYRVCGQTVLCYPLVFEVSDFYLSHDMALLIDDIKTELHFVGKYWRLSGRPTVCILIREEHMRDVHFRELLDLLAKLKTGYCDGLKVRTGRLQNLINSSCIEHLDFMSSVEIDLNIQPFQQLEHRSIGYQSLTDVPQAIKYIEEDIDFSDMVNKSNEEIVKTVRSVSALRGQMQLLKILLQREGLGFDVNGTSVKERLESLLSSASVLRYWAVVRECTALLSKEVESISPYITTVLVSGKQLGLGSGKYEITLEKPVQPGEVHKIFYPPELNRSRVVEAVLQQELVLYCGKLIGTHPHLFQGILNIRIGLLLRAMQYYVNEISGEKTAIEAMAPNEVRRLVYKILSLDEWAREEKLTCQQIRVINGCLGKTPSRFYEKVWLILEKTPHGMRIGDQVLLQQPTISEMSRAELNFAYCVQAMLNHIEKPAYRQLIVELLCVIATILVRNPELRFIREVNLDELFQEAFDMFSKDQKALKHLSDSDLPAFYNSSSATVTSYLARSVVNFLLTGDIKSDIEEDGSSACKLS